jgi:hypothetical protein
MATPSDLDTAYSDALRGDKGDVHLLRLIQKTGPVWSKLAPHTCKALVAVFIKHVRVGCCPVSCVACDGGYITHLCKRLV